MSHTVEFPGFPPSELPAIPSDWSDNSWHLDACPSFKTGNGLQVFTDRAKPSERENPDCARFSIIETLNGESVYSSDNWADVLGFVSAYGADRLGLAGIQPRLRLAREFGAQVQEALTRAEFRLVVDLNKAESDPSICHTHDFCDANMLMDAAMRKVFGFSMDAGSDMLAEIWSDAWAIAKQADFYA